jgi:hypothetical protein
VLTDLLARLRRGEVTAVATVERQLELLRRAHAVTNGVAAFEDKRALADAAALDRVFAAATTAERGRSERCTVCRSP